VRGLGGSFPGWLHAYHRGNSIGGAHEQFFQVVDDGTHYGIGKLVLDSRHTAIYAGSPAGLSRDDDTARTLPYERAAREGGGADRRPGRDVSPERDRQRSPAGVRRSGRSLARAQTTHRRSEGAHGGPNATAHMTSRWGGYGGAYHLPAETAPARPGATTGRGKRGAARAKAECTGSGMVAAAGRGAASPTMAYWPRALGSSGRGKRRRWASVTPRISS
jgi:hypothetical protein